MKNNKSYIFISVVLILSMLFSFIAFATDDVLIAEKDDYASRDTSKAQNAFDSYNVYEVTSGSRAYFGDKSRLTRIAAGEDGWAIYNVQYCETMVVQACMISAAAPHLKFYNSDDCETWSEITEYSREDLGQTPEGYSYVGYNYTIDINNEYKYVKILIPDDGTTYEYDIQLNYTILNRVKYAQVTEEIEELITEKNWTEAMNKAESVDDEEKKAEFKALVKDTYKTELEACISELENNPQPEDLEGKIDSLNEYSIFLEQILGEEDSAEFKGRITALEESLNAIRIEAYRFKERFDFAAGTPLSEQGWYADAEQTQSLDGEYVLTEQGIFQKSGNVQMFKSFVVPMELTNERDYYFSFEFSVGDGEGFTGLRLKNGSKYFGVKTVGTKHYPILNFGEMVVGSTPLPESNKYTAVFKLTENISYLSVYPSGEYPNTEWEISGKHIMETVAEEYEEKDDYATGNSSKAPNALTCSNVKEVTSSRIYYGDDTRLCRIDAEKESYVTYNVENCKMLTVQACKVNADTPDIEFYVSDDGENWEGIEYTRQTKGSMPEGYSYVGYDYTIDLNREHKYIKILIPKDTSNVNNIQINYSLFASVRDVPVEVMTEETVEVYSDSGLSLYSITQEENYDTYTKELETSVEKMVLSKRLEDIESATENAEALLNCIYKEFATAKINGYLVNNKNTLPVFDMVSITGDARVGASLVANVIYTDVYGNYKESNVKWYLGDKLLHHGTNYSVSPECEGKTVRVEAMVVNVFDKESDVKTAQIQIRRNEIEESYGSGGSGGNGGGYKSNDTTLNVVPVVVQPSENTINQNSFADIKNHWAEREIEKLVELKIINGIENNKFAPDEAVTRAQFAAFIARLMKFEEKNTDSSFEDVSENAWYNGCINYVFENNIMSGSTDGFFYPDRFITREEMAKVIATVCIRDGINKEIEDTQKVFNDDSVIEDWAKDYVKICVDLKIINGMPDGSFAPKGNTTRAEAAVVLNRLIDLINS